MTAKIIDGNGLFCYDPCGAEFHETTEETAGGEYMSECSMELEKAADALRGAEALLICAGAGMGVDSGLPDFRGDEGFWNAYPPYRALKVSFARMASPEWFHNDPSFAWGFYGHRRNLYRATEPHEGFSILRRWGEKMARSFFVYTSNVDNQFQKAGFDPDRIEECHGAIEWNQCLADCGAGIFPAGPELIDIDMNTMHASEKSLPRCPACGSLARPNILMFGDYGWDSGRVNDQNRRIEKWLAQNLQRPIVIIECGAGRAIPTVRNFSELIAASGKNHMLIRINPRDYQVPSDNAGIPMASLEGLRALDRLMK